MVKTEGYQQISRHYVICGTAIAEKRIRERRKLIILNPSDNKPRIVIDDSEGKKGLAHLENVHIEHNEKDADKELQFLKDITQRETYLPSQVKEILDQILKINSQSAMRTVDLISAIEKLKEVLEKRL